MITIYKSLIKILEAGSYIKWHDRKKNFSFISSKEERMLGHMGHEEIDKSIEKVIWSFKYPIHDSEKFDVPCESMTHSMTHKNSLKLP